MMKREHRRLHNLGTKLSEETKRKMSLAHIGRIRTQEHCDNISKSKMGHGVSLETRKKIADEEFREIIKIANGHKKTLGALAKH